MLTLTLAVTLLLSGGPAADSRAAALPVKGVLEPGESLGGVRLGDTAAGVKARWGASYTRCSVCDLPTWLFTYAKGSPAGAAVS